MPFEKGKVGNPKGLPQLPSELLGLKQLTIPEFRRILSKYLWMDYHDLSNLSDGIGLKAKKVSTVDAIIIRTIKKAIVTGDLNKVTYLLDRLFGKLTEKVEVNAEISHHRIMEYIKK